MLEPSELSKISSGGKSDDLLLQREEKIEMLYSDGRSESRKI